MSQDDTQTILERKALENVRAHLDREEREQPIRSLGEAAAHMATTLPVAIGIVVIVIAMFAAGTMLYRRSVALPDPTNRAEYVTNVFTKAERDANDRHRRVYEGLRGQVGVAFRVRPNGKVEAVEIAQSSYNTKLDDAALTLVTVGAPYGKFPPGAGTEPLSVRGSWQFEGDRATFQPR